MCCLCADCICVIYVLTVYVMFQYGPVNQAQLAEACFVVNVLEPRVKHDLLSWFVKLQLAEYAVLFADNQDVSRLLTHFNKEPHRLDPACCIRLICPCFNPQTEHFNVGDVIF